MSRPAVITTCDKCDKEDKQSLLHAKPSIGEGYSEHLLLSWLPKGWRMHSVDIEQPGGVPVSSDTFILCDDCESKFQKSVREFKP